MMLQSDWGLENTLVDKVSGTLILWLIWQEPHYDEYTNYQEWGLIGVQGMDSSGKLSGVSICLQ